MTIHELEPRRKFGPFKSGQKLGRVVQPGEVIHLETTSFMFPDGINSYAARVMEGDVVSVISSHEDDSGYVQTELASLSGDKINLHSMVGRKICYVPEV